jgi:hypothetical protein
MTPACAQVIEMNGAAAGTPIDKTVVMMTIQIPFGELLEAVIDDLMDTYNDRDLAMAAAQAIANVLLDSSSLNAD